MKRITILLLLLFPLLACSPIENKARDTAAALGGSLSAAQAKYHDTCVANPLQKVCVLINNGIAGENALITSIETYCGWSTLAPPTDMAAKCVPVKSAEGALTIAIANAAQLTLEIKGAI
jgi:hypothetical protein